jgi:hypothetical protein
MNTCGLTLVRNSADADGYQGLRDVVVSGPA